MSYTVKAATAAAVSASISTPVCPLVLTVETIRTPFVSTRTSTSAWDSINGWHKGISSEVFFEAITPAIRAISSGFPFGFSGSFFSTDGRIFTNACARAVRCVVCFAETSTMRASPAES